MSEPNEPPFPEKPRRSTQFQPGQSGNPRGRPKRNVDISVALNNALNDKIAFCRATPRASVRLWTCFARQN